MTYSTTFKAKMVRQMTGPEARSANALAEETGISQSTLSRWLREAGGDEVATMKKKRQRPGERSAEERLALLSEAATLSDEDLGAFLRRHGLHQAHLDEWRALALQGLEAPPKRKTCGIDIASGDATSGQPMGPF